MEPRGISTRSFHASPYSSSLLAPQRKRKVTYNTQPEVLSLFLFANSLSLEHNRLRLPRKLRSPKDCRSWVTIDA